MAEFFLNRIVLPRTNQLPIFGTDTVERDILKRIIEQKPSLELRSGQIWHIGNIVVIDNDSLMFAVGRTAKSKIERLDANSGDFIEERSDTAPFTHAVIDLNYQILAIASRSTLAPTPANIASRVAQIINQSPILTEAGRDCEVLPISDPEDFIATVQSAYRLYVLTIEFGRPNPWDADEQFQKPMQNLLREADGKAGKTTVNGNNLNREVVEKIARSTSASGRDAKIHYQQHHRGRTAIKHLKGDTAKLRFDEDAAQPEAKQKLISLVRDLYNSISKRL